VGGKALAELPADDGSRYWAFISYSHRDAAFGRRLHRQLENYALPRRLVGRETKQGTVPRKLAPIFRDREEFAAAHDLSAQVREALRQSRCLIVVCSPASAGSEWVSREIALFRELHPDRPILAAVRDGEPHECFPPALLGEDASGTAIEPLAADFRRGRDGEHLALLKLVAGVLGLGLDELVQRDATRRNQRVTAVTAGALLAMIVMGVLTAFALNARSEADRQRAEAEGLVEYMLTDLRDKLKGVGRLDVMTAVNERALKYYGDQDLSKLSADSLARRARIFHAMGEDDETRGSYISALAEFGEARRITAALLAEAPNDPERIFDHSQSVYWIGLADYDHGNYTAAQNGMLAYKALIERTLSLDPNNQKYRLNLGEADSSLCAVAVSAGKQAKAAVKFCIAALAETKAAAAQSKLSPEEIASNVIDRHAWLADAYQASGSPAQAKAERLIEEQMVNDQIAKDPRNKDLRDTWITVQRALAQLEATENTASARKRLSNAIKSAGEMAKFDPANQRWETLRSDIEEEMRELNVSARKEK
jgi:hypothetical protein